VPTGEGGVPSALTRQVLQLALDAEMAAHLGYERGDRIGHADENMRNGSSPKTVKT
jgi:putative transposase